MIRTLVAILPKPMRGTVLQHLALTLVSAIIRALGVMTLIPLVAALFSRSPSSAWPWAALLAGITLTGWIVDAIIGNLAFRLGFGMLDHTQRTLADRAISVRLTWFTPRRVEEARAAIGAPGNEIVSIVAYLVTPFLAAVILPIVIAIALLSVSVPLAVAAFLGVPLLFGTFWLSARLSKAADRIADDSNAALSRRVLEFARTQKALRAARRVRASESTVHDALQRQHASVVRMLAAHVPGEILFTLASQFVLFALVVVVVRESLVGAVTAPVAIALIVVAVRYLEPFAAIAELAAAMEGTSLTLAKMRSLIDAPLVSAGERERSSSTAPEIVLDDVSFGYGEIPVLSGLSFTLSPGSTTAIVGPSGSGKSTILSLIAGLHEPTSGSIRVDGVDLRELTPEARRALSTAVFQEPFLFAGSVDDNVRVGDVTASVERIRTAKSLARVDEVTARLPDGALSEVGPGGGMLSGGERQRVSIARALVKPAPVLLVDEATSALDTENERAIVDALAHDPDARTRVIIAHRLASIRAADRVLFVEAGQVVEDGSVDELLAAGGRFAEFWRQQNAAVGWRIGRRQN